MSKLQATYWALMVVPWVVPLAARWALRIWGKNLRPHINKKPHRFPPYHPPKLSLTKPDEAPALLETCSKTVRHC